MECECTSVYFPAMLQDGLANALALFVYYVTTVILLPGSEV